MTSVEASLPEIEMLVPTPAEGMVPGALELPTIDAYVRTVRAKGDLLSQTPWFKHLPSVGNVALAASGAMGAMYTATGMAGEVPLLLAATTAAQINKALQRKSMRQQFTRVLQERRTFQQACGLEVDMLTTGEKKPNPVLSWRTGVQDFKPEVLIPKLDRLRDIALATGIPTIELPAQHIEDYLTAAQQRRLTHQDDRYPYGKDLLSEDEVTIRLRPGELDQITSTIDVMRQVEPIDQALAVLRQVMPNHPALQFARSANPLIRKKLERVLEGCIARRYSEIDFSQSPVGRDDDVGTYVQEHIGPLSESARLTPSEIHRITSEFERSVEPKSGGKVVHLQATPYLQADQPKLAYFDELATPTLSRNLLDGRRLSMKKLETILHHPHRFSKRFVIEVCEISAWLLLKGIEVEVPEAERVPDAMVDRADLPFQADDIVSEPLFAVKAFQPRLVNWLISPGKKRSNNNVEFGGLYHNRRILRSLAKLGVSFGLGALIAHGADMRMGDARDAAQVLVESGDAHTLDEALEVELRNDSAGQVTRLRQRLGDELAAPMEWLVDKLPEPPSVDAGRESIGPLNNPADVVFHNPSVGLGVGNVERLDAWQQYARLTSFGGMSTSGYWFLESANWLDIYDGGDRTQSSLAWTPNYFGTSLGHISPSWVSPLAVSIPWQDQPHITVAIDLKPGHMDGLACDPVVNLPCQDVAVLRNLPILHGTRIVSARIDGQEFDAQLVVFASGVQTIGYSPDFFEDINWEQAHELTYDLVPDTLSSVNPRAMGPIVVRESLDSDSGVLLLETAAETTEALEERFNIELSDDISVRLDQVVELLTTAYYYDEAPLPDDLTIRHPEDLIDAAINATALNCNIAATMGAMTLASDGLSIREPDLNLMLAAGFLNSPDEGEPMDTLNFSEAHAYLVDGAGSIHDPTPGRRPPEQAPNPLTSPLAFYALVGVGLVGLGAHKRQAMSQAAGRVWLTTLRKQRLEKAYQAHNHAHWAPEDQPFRFTHEITSEDMMLGSLTCSQPVLIARGHPSVYRRAIRRANKAVMVLQQEAQRYSQG